MKRTSSVVFRVLVLAIVFFGVSQATKATPPENTAMQETAEANPGGIAAASKTALKPFDWVDTSSPRSTLKSFLVGTQRYYDLIREDGYTDSNWRELNNILDQAERLFDLRAVPPGQSRNVAHETAALVREALARAPLPLADEVPDEDEMAERFQAGKSLVYRVPNTPFEIARTDEGPNTGRYQFTRETVTYAPAFYKEIEADPYDPTQRDISGLYEAYFLSPGPLIPREWIGALPGWMQFEFLANRIWQWLFLVAILAMFGVVIFFLHISIHHISRKWKPLSRNLLLLLRPLMAIVLTLVLSRFLTEQVRLTGKVERAVEFGEHLVLLFASVVITMVLGSVLAETLVNVRRFQHAKLDQQLIRLLVRLLALVIAAVIVIEEMQQMGFSIATLLAGASVGGLAVALAAQDTLKNIFGGIELSLDKPFVVGHRVKIKGYHGHIEEIGLRSTRVRTLSGHLVTIPNEEVSKLDIENIGRRPYIRRKFNITITYDTPPEKIRKAVDIIREILSVPTGNNEEFAPDELVATNASPHPNVAINKREFPPRVYFDTLNADSLNILVYYWYHPPKYWDYLEHAQSINTQIMERFEAEGISFAFPTQTLFVAGDDKRPLAVTPPWATSDDGFPPMAPGAQATTDGS